MKTTTYSCDECDATATEGHLAGWTIRNEGHWCPTHPRCKTPLDPFGYCNQPKHFHRVHSWSNNQIWISWGEVTK